MLRLRDFLKLYKLLESVSPCIFPSFRIYSTLYFRLIVPHLAPDLAEKFF